MHRGGAASWWVHSSTPLPMEMQCEILASHLSGRFTDLHGTVCEVALEQPGDFFVGRARGLPHPLHHTSTTRQCFHAVLHNIPVHTTEGTRRPHTPHTDYDKCSMYLWLLGNLDEELHHLHEAGPRHQSKALVQRA